MNVRSTVVLVGVAALLAQGCSLAFMEGRSLEAQNRWEEAAIQYHLAVIKDPEDAEYRDAWERAKKQVARDNFERYKVYLGNKEFSKAYQRLVDASRQDPDYEPVKQELGKWQRVLLAGQVRFDFRSLQANTSLADELKLAVRLNTPNPGEVVEAEIDVSNGIFSVENLLYDRPDEMLTYFSLNSIGVGLVLGRNKVRQFTSRDFVRFINYRTPVLENTPPPISLAANTEAQAQPVLQFLRALGPDTVDERPQAVRSNPRYTMAFQGNRVVVSSADGRSDFTPRFLYVNKQDRRVFVDFGRYTVKQDDTTGRWGLARLPQAQQDYLLPLFRNLALQPYFFYRESVLEFVARKAG